ncbi:MAG: sigma-70 family RNA polymerase sigma factor [Ruthenibacterium lactatiformans]|nr:sigma-70 family RNA polymerase sigma factor [Ruthenibacterium lactatiformans]MDY4943690.1 sigma-70 family RNA polymerase sigma factor [Ruthenibacterium lactatiformans]
MFGIIFSFVASQILYFALHLESSSFPKPLSARDEIAAFEAMKNGDMAARDKLIRHNLRLVAHIVKKYYASSTDQEDLLSIGTIGLIKAVNSFDNTKGARFATYAARCIENAILSKRKKRRLRWKTMNLLGQNGLCSAAWKSAAMYWLRMLQVH